MPVAKQKTSITLPEIGEVALQGMGITEELAQGNKVSDSFKWSYRISHRKIDGVWVKTTTEETEVNINTNTTFGFDNSRFDTHVNSLIGGLDEEWFSTFMGDTKPMNDACFTAVLSHQKGTSGFTFLKVNNINVSQTWLELFKQRLKAGPSGVPDDSFDPFLS